MAAAVLAIGGGLTGAASADATLPTKTPEQLIAALSRAKVDGLSGTVITTSNLGLPKLPTGKGGRADSEFTDLVSGTHTLRVWTAGDDRSRVALLDRTGESSLIRNGNQAWAWSSGKQEVQHTAYTGGKAPKGKAKVPSTPHEAAQRALDTIGPSTTTDVARDVTVAGRPAYELVLEPKDERSLLTAVRIAVDAETSVPLRVEAMADDQSEPAFSVGFRSVDFSVPSKETFEFTPPAGAKVVERKVPAGPKHDKASSDKPTVVGDGWTAVTITDTSAMDDKGRRQLEQSVGALPKISGEWGSGRLLAGTAFSAVLADDGRIAVGSVEPDLLYAALGK